MSAGLLSVSVDRAFIQILRAAKHADDIRVGPKSLGAEPTARIRLNLPIRTRNNRSLGELSSVETSLQLFSNVAQIGSHVVFSLSLSLSRQHPNEEIEKRVWTRLGGILAFDKSRARARYRVFSSFIIAR